MILRTVFPYRIAETTIRYKLLSVLENVCTPINEVYI